MKKILVAALLALAPLAPGAARAAAPTEGAALVLDKATPGLRQLAFRRAARGQRSERQTVLIRFIRPLSAGELEAIDDPEIDLARDSGGAPLLRGRLVEARVSAAGLWQLDEDPRVLDLSPALPAAALPPARDNPYDDVLELTGAPSVWPLRTEDGAPLRGEGVTLADIDSGIDVLHPFLFRSDGGLYAWIDADEDGAFTPGTDGVDLDEDGELAPEEILHAFGGDLFDNGGQLVDPVYDFDPARSWLYADTDLSGSREAGAAFGFTDDDPAFGEPLFLADDVDKNGELDPLEKVVRLRSSKVKAVYQPATSEAWIRGESLSAYPHYPDTDRSHGTGVAGILVGGDPDRTFVHGVAPDADLVMIDRLLPPGVDPGMVDFEAGTMAAAEFAASQGAKIFVHEYGQRTGEYDDGSSATEELLDELSADGLIQATATHNFANNQGDARVIVSPGETATVTFEVFNQMGYGAQALVIDYKWAGAEPGSYPLLRLVAPDGGDSHALAFENFDGALYSLTDKSVSSRGTGLVASFLYQIQGGNQAVLFSGGQWTLEIENPTAQTLDGIVTVSDHTAYSAYTALTSHPETDESTVAWPSTADAAISVGASVGNRIDDPREVELGIRPFSGRGPRIDGELTVDIIAPSDHYTSQPGGEYGPASLFRFGGTSGALPQVAGALALLLQAEPDLSPAEAKARLHEAGDDFETGPLPNRHWGYGRLDVYRLLRGEDAPANTAPELGLDAPALVGAGHPFFVDTTETTDAEDDLDELVFAWDIDYDGSFDVETTGPEAELTLEEVGPHRVRVEVRDPFGGAAATVLDIYAEQVPPEGPPEGAPTGCGCSAGAEPTGGALVGLGLIGWLRGRRRQRPGRRH